MSGRIALPDSCPIGQHEPGIVHRTGGADAKVNNRCGRCGREIYRSTLVGGQYGPWMTFEQTFQTAPTLAPAPERGAPPQRVYGTTRCLGCQEVVDVVYVYTNSDDSIGLIDHIKPGGARERCPHAGLTIWTKGAGWTEERFRNRYGDASIAKPAPLEYPVCPECGAVCHGNLTCRTCRGVMRTRGSAPSELLDQLDASAVETIAPCGPEAISGFLRKLQGPIDGQAGFDGTAEEEPPEEGLGLLPCEKCGGREFKIDAVYAATDTILVSEDGDGFELLDTSYGDGDWEDHGRVRCVVCDLELEYNEWRRRERKEETKDEQPTTNDAGAAGKE